VSEIQGVAGTGVVGHLAQGGISTNSSHVSLVHGGVLVRLAFGLGGNGPCRGDEGCGGLGALLGPEPTGLTGLESVLPAALCGGWCWLGGGWLVWFGLVLSLTAHAEGFVPGVWLWGSGLLFGNCIVDASIL
jgi:hypothetical protein